jgi:hypothetical protein
MVAAAIRTIFAQPDAQHLHDQLDVIAGMLGRQFPSSRSCCATRPRTCWPYQLPPGHWKGLVHQPLGAAQQELKRRTDVVGVSPTPTPCRGWPGRCWSRPTTNGKSATAASSRKAPWPPHRDHQGGDASPAHAGIDPPTPTGTAPRAYHAAGRHRGALRAIDASARPRSWRTFGPRRLRRQSELALAVTQGGRAGGTPQYSTVGCDPYRKVG